jgi:hypothetical protein
METDLQTVSSALADLTDSELHALIDATKNVPQIAPGLLAWIEAACDAELNHRQGRDYALRRPAAAIAPEEDAARIYTILTLRALFGQGARGVPALFDAIVELLSGAERKH